MACPALDLAGAASVLASGGVLILPTDTLPGLHARADNPAAVARVRALKGSAQGKPLVVLAGSMEQAWSLLEPLSTEQERICRRCWPGPYTLILPGADLTAPSVAAAGGRLAVRVPDRQQLCELILAAGGPLVSTSVNPAAEAPAGTLAEAAASFGPLVDGYWKPDGVFPGGAAVASCLVDLTRGSPQVLREGPLPFPPPLGGGLDDPCRAV